MQNPTRLQTTGQTLELFHVQTNTSIELPPNFTVIRIGKPKEQFIPDINVATLPNTDFVSRLHAEIQTERSTFYLVDLGSTNGTYLNNMRLEPRERYPLSLGDKIDLGHGSKVTFIFLQKQHVVDQSDTILNNPPTVIQIEFLPQSDQSLMKRFSRPVGLVLISTGLLIVVVWILTGHAFTPVSLLAILASCVLSVAGYRLFTTGKILN